VSICASYNIYISIYIYINRLAVFLVSASIYLHSKFPPAKPSNNNNNNTNTNNTQQQTGSVNDQEQKKDK
jgi:hypothetical protein